MADRTMVDRGMARSGGKGGKHKGSESWGYNGPKQKPLEVPPTEPVRTLKDMTPEEIAAIEKRYGMKVKPRVKPQGG